MFPSTSCQKAGSAASVSHCSEEIDFSPRSGPEIGCGVATLRRHVVRIAQGISGLDDRRQRVRLSERLAQDRLDPLEPQAMQVRLLMIDAGEDPMTERHDDVEGVSD